MTDLKQMTAIELKQYLSDYRSDDEKFHAALSELLSRESNPTIYPANMPLEEMERIIKEKIEQAKQK
jgi:hypothetical protein